MVKERRQKSPPVARAWRRVLGPENAGTMKPEKVAIPENKRGQCSSRRALLPLAGTLVLAWCHMLDLELPHVLNLPRALSAKRLPASPSHCKPRAD